MTTDAERLAALRRRLDAYTPEQARIAAKAKYNDELLTDDELRFVRSYAALTSVIFDLEDRLRKIANANQ
jgi:hypothetical protein